MKVFKKNILLIFFISQVFCSDLVTKVSFGRRLRAVVTVPGPGLWITIVQVWPGTPTISPAALVFVV